MAEIPLRVAKEAPFALGDVYYNDHLKDWVVVLPLDIHFALNTSSGDCPHHGNVGRHRCWNVSGDEGLAHGDASKLTLTPSILAEHWKGTIHGFITDGKWRDC